MSFASQQAQEPAMEINKLVRTLSGLGLLTLIACLGPLLTPKPAPPQNSPQASPYVILSGEFFSAMEKLGKSGATYGDRTEPLLEQIALTSQYMVKTNLTLIQQNDRIIQLLEEFNRQRRAAER
jgi:hypothetical protein